MHRRSPAAEDIKRRHRRRHRQTADRLRLPCADHELSGAGHADDRADRIRIEGRARPLLRGHDRDPAARSPRSRTGRWKVEASPLRHAPHTVHDIADDDWARAYSRAEGCFPAGTSRTDKYWCPVGRVDNVYGDRNLVCSCPPVDGLRAGGGVRRVQRLVDSAAATRCQWRAVRRRSQRHSRSLVSSVPPHQRWIGLCRLKSSAPARMALPRASATACFAYIVDDVRVLVHFHRERPLLEAGHGRCGTTRQTVQQTPTSQ